MNILLYSSPRNLTDLPIFFIPYLLRGTLQHEHQQHTALKPTNHLFCWTYTIISIQGHLSPRRPRGLQRPCYQHYWWGTRCSTPGVWNIPLHDTEFPYKPRIKNTHIHDYTPGPPITDMHSSTMVTTEDMTAITQSSIMFTSPIFASGHVYRLWLWL